MKDPIERQDVIDELKKISFSHWFECGEYLSEDTREIKIISENKALEAIEALPSAQPEPSTEIQEILDYLDNTLHPIVSPDNWNVYSELHDMVSKLPSVQPERGTGAWIINDEYPQHCWCSECNHFFSLFDPKSIHFCPNCGSEMKTCVLKSQYEKEN